MINAFFISIIFLIVLSFLDIKTFNLKEGFIPAVLTTSFIAITFALAGISGIIAGLFGLIISFLLIDLDVFHGLADMKIFIACSITLPSILMVSYFGAFTCFIGLFYKILLKKTKFKEIPFIPVLLIAYLGIVAIIVL